MEDHILELLKNLINSNVVNDWIDIRDNDNQGFRYQDWVTCKRLV